MHDEAPFWNMWRRSGVVSKRLALGLSFGSSALLVAEGIVA